MQQLSVDPPLSTHECMMTSMKNLSKSIQAKMKVPKKTKEQVTIDALTLASVGTWRTTKNMAEKLQEHKMLTTN